MQERSKRTKHRFFVLEGILAAVSPYYLILQTEKLLKPRVVGNMSKFTKLGNGASEAGISQMLFSMPLQPVNQWGLKSLSLQPYVDK